MTQWTRQGNRVISMVSSDVGVTLLREEEIEELGFACIPAGSHAEFFGLRVDGRCRWGAAGTEGPVQHGQGWPGGEVSCLDARGP